MFVLKILALNLLFVVYSVMSDDTENVQKTSYKFNHPPMSEGYHSIPVAVVYDEPASSDLKFSEKVVTTYHPRFKALETVTEQNRYEESSSTIDNEDFSAEEERRVQKLRKKLRKARLRLRADILPDNAAESTTIWQSNPEDIGSTKEVDSKSNTVYKVIDRSRQRGQRVISRLEKKLSTEELFTTETANTEQSNNVQKETNIRVTTLQEDVNETVKPFERTESPHPVRPDRKKKQGVRSRVKTEAPSGSDIYEATSTPPKVEQPNRKQSRGRGSIKYRNYESATIQTVTAAKISSTPENEVENYPKMTPNLIKSRANLDVATEELQSIPERENYPSSEQPKLTNNRPGPKNEKPRLQSNILIPNEQTNKVPQGGRQRLRYYSQSPINAVEKDTKIKISSTIESENYSSTLRTRTSEEITTEQPEGTTEEENYPKLPMVPLQLRTNEQATTVQPVTITEEENYPKLQSPVNAVEKDTKIKSSLTVETENFSSTLRSRTSEKIATEQPVGTTEEENYPKLPIVPLQLKTNERATSVKPTRTTEEENYPKLPIVPIKQQLKTNEKATNLESFPTSEEENYPKLRIVPKASDKVTLLSISTTEGTKHSETLKPKTNEAVTIQPTATTEEEYFQKTPETLSQYRGQVSDVQLSATRQYVNPSTLKPKTLYQQGKQEDTQVQNEMFLPKDVDGRVITLKSSFDVATISPLAKSVLQKNNKAKVIYKVQKTETLSDVTDELNTLSTTTEITFAAETIGTTEKPFINENQIKSQEQKNRSHFQYQNEAQIPVIIVYDNSDPSIPVNQRKILRTKINPVNNGEIIKPDKLVKPVDEVKVQESPKTGNVTENVNAERRTRGRKPVVPILESENHVYAQTGKFNYRYESGDGTNAFQEGILKPFDDDVTGEAVKGGFSYTDKDGNDFSLSYTADENGYRPIGAHLPTPPPIPPAIARALAYLATKSTPNPDEVTGSSLDDVY